MMHEYHISENDADQRIDRFLMKACPTLPKNLLYKYIRNKKIKVNKKRCTISQRLQSGDSVQCYMAEEFFQTAAQSYDFLQVPDTLHIVYEDENILVAYKPMNLLVQKDQAGIQDNMNDRLLHYLYRHGAYDPRQEQSFTPAFAHRLDRNTEGILLAGKKARALRELNEKLKTHEIAKYYLALVEGIPKKAADDLIFYHKKDYANNKAQLYIEAVEGSKRIHTSYRILDTLNGNALLEIQLHTGKSHQIRSSMAMLHHPLIGDVKYHAKPSSVFSHQALCAYRVRFAFCEQPACLGYLQGKEIVLTDSYLQDYVKTHQCHKADGRKDINA